MIERLDYEENENPFISESKIEIDIKNELTNKEISIETPTQNPSYKCNGCRKSFGPSKGLKSHKKHGAKKCRKRYN